MNKKYGFDSIVWNQTPKNCHNIVKLLSPFFVLPMHAFSILILEHQETKYKKMRGILNHFIPFSNTVQFKVIYHEKLFQNILRC